MVRIRLALWLLVATGCASAVLLPEADRRSLAERWEGKAVFLRSSLNVMPFFADPTRRLVSPYFPDSIDLVDDASGRPMFPGRVEDLLPLGTGVRIDRLEYPTSLTMAGRAMGTPRNCPWVYLTVAGGQSRPLVAVLRRGMLTEEEFAAALAELFSDEAAGLSMTPEVRHAVEQKKLLMDMDPESVRLAWGRPETTWQNRATEESFSGSFDSLGKEDSCRNEEQWSWPLGLRTARFRRCKLISATPPLESRE